MFAENFTYDEFIYSELAARHKIDNAVYDNSIMMNLHRLSFALQRLRDELSEYRQRDTPIIISSGYRSPALNLLAGGAKKSQHKLGLAADIRVANMSPFELAKFIHSRKGILTFDQVILEFQQWVHFSTNPLSVAPRYSVLTSYWKNRKLLPRKVAYRAGIHELELV